MRAIRAASLCVLITCSAHAQGTYEIEVYNSDIAPVKSLLLELHSNYTFRGSEVTASSSHAPLIDDMWISAGTNGFAQRVSAGVFVPGVCSQSPFYQTNSGGATVLQARAFAAAAASCSGSIVAGSYAEHETIEAVTGLSSWSEIGAYLFTSEQQSPVILPIGGSLRIKARVPMAWNWPVGVALSTEIEYNDPRYTTDPWSWEIRPVIDKALGRWYVSLNPTLERTLQGTGVVNGLQFSPSAKVGFDFTSLVSGGVEYYGAYGRIGSFAPPESRLQQFFGVVDLHVSPLWEANAGVGTGTTPATNHLMAKLILGRRFSWN
jgi:hypothetical protein